MIHLFTRQDDSNVSDADVAKFILTTGLSELFIYQKSIANEKDVNDILLELLESYKKDIYVVTDNLKSFIRTYKDNICVIAYNNKDQFGMWYDWVIYKQMQEYTVYYLALSNKNL